MGSKNREKGVRETLWVGIALMFFGFVFLADRLELLDLGRIGVWWPYIPIAIGTISYFAWSGMLA